ncbi:MAG TPA: tRNA guanosine(34) transglycosylase Tgt, partial [Acidimicrobiales bacterium]|nr:tRNA guanosine(34) transglycosylase Tgt [Acidimicrobiales bacterium]
MTAIRMDVVATDGAARAATVLTARGTFPTPCFMPVGTRGTVRTLDAGDLAAIGADVVLANTYHLMLRPGAEVVAACGDLHGFSGWAGHMLTDSGGYQVFSLHPDVDDDGVAFRSTYDGSRHRLTPEGAVAVQEALGADIQMALDICAPLPSTTAALRDAMVRTAAWAVRARRAHRREGQAIFGIVQGGADVALRAESAARTVEVGFDGYGIGGLSVGEPRAEMLPALAAALAGLPADQPRYLMGVGDPVSVVEAVALGVDMFDCVLPTRLGRHGTALTSGGKVQIKAAVNARDLGPIEEGCGCRTCSLHSRAYLRHLFMVSEPSGARLLSWHNLAWQLRLMSDIRQAIV